MTSFFSKDNIIPSIKRQTRPRTRKAKQSCWKDFYPLAGKALHVVPEVSEEDEHYPQTFPSTPSPCSSHIPRNREVDVIDIRAAKQTIEKRASRPRPVGFTGAEDLSLSLNDSIWLGYESPRPAPRPPTFSTPERPSRLTYSSSPHESDASDSPDSFNLNFTDIGLFLDFPRPPSSVSNYGSPRSPTPSLMSNYTSSTSASSQACSSGLPTTPVTSDDEFLSPPSSKSPHKRASVRPLVIARKTDSIVPVVSEADSFLESLVDEEDGGDWIDEDSDWYTHQFEDILTLCSPLPTSFPSTVNADNPGAARPDSFPPPRRPDDRATSAPVSADAGPSAQLDPTFPVKRRSAVRIPKRPPPPIPTRTSSSARRRTGCSYDVSRNAPPLTIAIPTRPRPPPRMSVPADVMDVLSELLSPAEEELSSPAHSDLEYVIQSPETPGICSPDTSSASDGEYYAEAFTSPLRLDLPFCTSPLDFRMDVAAGLEAVMRGELGEAAARPESPVSSMYNLASPVRLQEQEKALRSRWSSSTLSSVVEHQPMSASSKIIRFNFGSSGASYSRKGKGNAKVKTSSGGLRVSASSPNRPTSVGSDSNSSVGSRTVRRRGSRNSKASDSGESCESAGSAGLRRKPIPVEMFIRS